MAVDAPHTRIFGGEEIEKFPHNGRPGRITGGERIAVLGQIDEQSAGGRR
ncbi:hypothetical protein AAC389_29955 (plasmid) [Rhodococcus qingshengii]